MKCAIKLKMLRDVPSILLSISWKLLLIFTKGKTTRYLAALPNARSTGCYFSYKESYEPAPGNMVNLPRVCYGRGRWKWK